MLYYVCFQLYYSKMKFALLRVVRNDFLENIDGACAEFTVCIVISVRVRVRCGVRVRGSLGLGLGWGFWN